MNEEEASGSVSGFVAILGRPNAGKSTLLNSLVGVKLAIVANKPQTTRTSIQGVLNLPGGQIVFIDTPGIHAADSLFNRRMMRTIRSALEAPDLILFLADATRPFTPADAEALQTFARVKAPAILVLNKVDRLPDKTRLLPLIESYRAAREFDDYVPVSALKGEGLETLRAAILTRLPAGPPCFPPDQLTDQPERYLAAELIREKILAETREEVPHSVAVLVDTWEETPNLLRIAATINVEKEGQKGILIGSRGAMLKRVGTLARLEMEAFFDRKIFLELFVKVRPRWRENPEFLDEIDWRSMAGKEES